ncbi:MAG: ATP-binding protein, partial [Deltaproteobacteria bacterium]
YEWIQEHYFELILSCCRKIDSGVQVHLEMSEGTSNPTQTDSTRIGNLPFVTRFQESQTFQSYVVATFNRLAFAAAQEVTNEGKSKFNPLFIEGPPGVGKTHLLHAIGNAAPARNPAVYLTCRSLLVVNSSLSSTVGQAFWEFLTSMQVLLVDDVHLLPAEGSFQQFLREVFNWCYDLDKQMVFTANRLPHQIPELIEGLRSRLSWGLIVRIREPDPDSYRQLIEAFLDASEIEVSEEISGYLAEQGSINFHDLKDFVEKLQEVVEKEGSLPTLKNKSLAIKRKSIPSPERLSLEAIQKEVCATYSVALEALSGAAKSRPLVIARQVGMYLSRKLTGSTYSAIGVSFGNRDHSTVIYACRKVRAEMRRNRSFAERVVEIEKRLLRI